MVSSGYGSKQFLEPLLLSVRLNQSKLSHVFLGYYNHQTKQLYISEKTLTRWALQIPSRSPLMINHNRYYQLNWYQGVRYRVDKHALTVSINMPMRWYRTHFYHPVLVHHNLLIRPKRSGLFLNYDAAASNTDTASISNLAATTELGVFSPAGVGSTSFFLRDINSNSSVKRLDTYWRIDQPEKVRTIILGDAITPTNSWSQSVRMAGITVETNYATQPSQITFPLPSASGIAVVPSAINLFVNNALVQSQRVEPGPFVINNIPTVSGSGNIEVITQNILGQKQVSVIPYYVTPKLKKQGLSSYAWSLGMIRRNYSIDNFNYAKPMAVLDYNHGVSNTLTLSMHIEGLLSQQTAGLSGYYLLHHYWLLHSSAAMSQENNKLGDLFQFGIERESSVMNYGVSSTWTSDHFAQLGYQEDSKPPINTTQAYFSFSPKKVGNFTVSYTFVASRTPDVSASPDAYTVPTADLLTVNYNRSLGHQLSLSANALINLREKNSNQYFFSLAWEMPSDKSMTFNSDIDHHDVQNSIDLNQNILGDTGFGYNILASQHSAMQFEGTADLRTHTGEYIARYSRLNRSNHYELNAIGSLIYFDRSLLASRQMDNSFALVKVPGFSKVPVYYQHRYIGKTNREGDLLVQNLLPYQKNSIDIGLKHLAINTSIDNDHSNIIPYYHSGVLVKFAIKKIYPIILHLKINSKKYVPAGAKVVITVPKSNIGTWVGYHGTVYLHSVTGSRIKGSVYWNNQRCRFKANLPFHRQSLLHLGNVSCVMY